MCLDERSQAWPAVCISLICLLLSVPAWSQASYTAQIRGVVKDQSGALVPNATVTITNDEEISFQSHGINLLTLRVACASCDDKKIQPMIAEDS